MKKVLTVLAVLLSFGAGWVVSPDRDTTPEKISECREIGSVLEGKLSSGYTPWNNTVVVETEWGTVRCKGR